MTTTPPNPPPEAATAPPSPPAPPGPPPDPVAVGRHQAALDRAADLLARGFSAAGNPVDLERAQVAALVSIASSLAILADNAVGQAPPSDD